MFPFFDLPRRLLLSRPASDDPDRRLHRPGIHSALQREDANCGRENPVLLASHALATAAGCLQHPSVDHHGIAIPGNRLSEGESLRPGERSVAVPGCTVGAADVRAQSTDRLAAGERHRLREIGIPPLPGGERRDDGRGLHKRPVGANRAESAGEVGRLRIPRFSIAKILSRCAIQIGSEVTHDGFDGRERSHCNLQRFGGIAVD